MEQRKNRSMWILFLILLVLFFAGMACEVALKYWNAAMMSHSADPAELITRRAIKGFGDEALPIWMIPSVVLKWMVLIPQNVWGYALRWIPYLVVFLLPAFGALMRRKWIPLIFCAILAGIETVGVLLVGIPMSKLSTLTWVHAIPFAIELILLILACIALGAKKKGFAITLGVFCALLALISPAVSALMAGLDANMFRNGFPIGAFLLSQIRRFPVCCATSFWPIFKAFAFLMYALLLFGGAARIRKKA